MATLAMTPVSEYLSTSYSPDRDYIDGEVRERKLGETSHGGIQAWIAAIFQINKKQWGFRAFTETRVQVSASRFRVPDVCVLKTGHAPGKIIRSAPAMCLEVLSPGDSLAEMQERVDDYVQMGVQQIWVLDPVKKLAWTANAEGIHPVRVGTFTVPGTLVSIALADLYQELDDIEAGS